VGLFPSPHILGTMRYLLAFRYINYVIEMPLGMTCYLYLLGLLLHP
jgi:uncharacterized membrane protein YbhN (UPF0104 family)